MATCGFACWPLESIGLANRNDEHDTLLDKGFDKAGTRLFLCSQNRNDMPKKRNMASHHILSNTNLDTT